MASKTPRFDATLDAVFAGLSPHQAVCVSCGAKFTIGDEDVTLLKNLRVPPPDECPECRMRKRFAMLANTMQFYPKECAAHAGERVVSQMDAENFYKVYDNAFWWNADVWDATEFGREYDPSRPFQDQLAELLATVPHMGIARYNKNIIESNYTAYSYDVKNCYLSSEISISKDIAYGLWVAYSNDSLDLLRATHVDNSYDVIDSDRIYNCQYVQDSTDCLDSKFLFDCHNCQNCFGCVNLRNRKHCFFNEQLTKDDYRARVGAIDLGNRRVRDEYQKRFNDFVAANGIVRAVRTKSSPNSVGDKLVDCKNCHNVFAAMSVKFMLTFYKNENLRWSQDVAGGTDSMDVSMFGPGSKCYNTVEALSVYNTIASYFAENCVDVEYCFECSDCRCCFGCSGLKKKHYCILNEQYSEDDYWKTLDEIKTAMLKDGTYGKFLPLGRAFFYYQDTYAQAMMPLTRDKAIGFGARWKDHETKVDARSKKIIAKDEVPENIKDAGDDMLECIIKCEESGKLFHITRPEIEFHRRYNIPLPTKHPQTRLFNRIRRGTPYKLWEISCARCGNNKTMTSYAPERRVKIYCEKCYKETVI